MAKREEGGEFTVPDRPSVIGTWDTLAPGRSSRLGISSGRGSEDCGVPVEEWMQEQDVECSSVVCSCCDRRVVRRRLARKVLFKRLTTEELERRYEKHRDFLLQAEAEAVISAIDKFQQGWYVGIEFRHRIGTFYAPTSPLLNTLAAVCRSPLSIFVFSHLIASSVQCSAGDNPYQLLKLLLCLCFPVAIMVDLLFLPLLAFLVLPLLVVFEILLLLGSLVFCYGIPQFQELGMFNYSWTVDFVVARSSATRAYGEHYYETMSVTKKATGAMFTITKAPLGRLLWKQPASDIFRGMQWETYNYGEVMRSTKLQQREIEMYRLRQTQRAELYSNPGNGFNNGTL